MKKSLIITIGIVLILIVLGIWGYLLFFGTPGDSDEVFANLGIGSAPAAPNDPPPSDPPPQDEGATRIDTQADALRQLTTRPVAGFTFMGTTSDMLRYVERGTGHVFEIDLTSGNERRVSGTTIPRVVEATFSESGESVALVSEEDYERRVLAGLLTGEGKQTDFISLPSGAFDPTFVSTHRVHYGVETTGGVEGYELDVRDEQPVRLFSIPLRDVTLVWDDGAFVYNRPTQQHHGALYSAEGGLSPVTPNAYGFVGGMNDAYFFATYSENGELRTDAYARTSDAVERLAVAYLPEKCASTASATSTLWCAMPLGNYPASFTEDWYKGIVQSEDLLWRAEITSGEAQLMSNLFEESGRAIDVDKMTVGPFSDTVLFRNRLDNTLWLYDSTLE